MSLQTLASLAQRTGRGMRWRPGAGGSCHSEIFACSNEAGGAGSALALALDDLHSRAQDEKIQGADQRAVLWVQTRDAARLTGRPYRPGLPAALRHRVIHVLADKAEDALFALEEGLRCREIAFVMGEIAGNPRALDFTASRRLTLTAERYGVPLYLIRLDAAPDLSSARMRWQMRAAPSAPPEWNPQAPGTPVWHAGLFRARGYAPGEWVLRDEPGGLAASRPFEATSRPSVSSSSQGERLVSFSPRSEEPKTKSEVPRRAASVFN